MTRRVTIEEIRKLSRQSKTILYGDEATWVQPEAPDDTSETTGTTAKSGPDSTPIQMVARAFSKFDRQNTIKKTLINALRIMKSQHEHNPQFLFRLESSNIGGVKGGASLLEAEKEAVLRNLIVKHSLPHAKTNACLWEITDTGYEQIKRARPRWRSRGGYLHKFCVHRIEHTYTGLGYHSTIEYQRPNGKLVDLFLSKGDHVIYVEVCACWPVEKELANIQKNFEGDPLPSELILAVTSRKMRKPLEQAVTKMAASSALPRPVRVALAGDLIDFLEVPK